MSMGKVLVKRDEAMSTTVGGIVLPEDAIETPDQGEIVCVGPEYLTESGDPVPFVCRQGDGEICAYRIGDRVVFAKSAGADLQLGTRDYVLMEQSDVLGRLREV